jgi:hypothetical protein
VCCGCTTTDAAASSAAGVRAPHLDGLPSQQLGGHTAQALPGAVIPLCPLHLLISQVRLPGQLVLRGAGRAR